MGRGMSFFKKLFSSRKDNVQSDTQETKKNSSKNRIIDVNDMLQFNFPQFSQLLPVIYYNGTPIMHIHGDNQFQVLNDITFLNQYIKEAKRLAKIRANLDICTEELIFNEHTGTSGITELYTYFECNPYTPTGKISKYPLILHYSTEDDCDMDTSRHGWVYYMQDGNIGKAEMCFRQKRGIYKIDLGCKGNTLSVQKVILTKGADRTILFKSQ